MKYFSVFKQLDEKGIKNFKQHIFSDNDALKETDSGGSSYLHICVIHGNIELAKFVIDKGIDVNIQDKKGATALHYCAVYNQFEIAKYILENNGNLDISDKFGNQPLWTATFNIRKDLSGLDILELFLNKGADIDHKNNVNKSPWLLANDISFDPTVQLMSKYR